ncbi:MAG: protein phosphatase 2C domain-containing protein [Bacteroidota bacterium]
MPFRTASPLTHAGGRATNQDFAGWREADGQTCWVLADGLGGHASGEIASEAAVEGALAAFEAHPGTDERTLLRCLARAQDVVRTLQDGNPDLSTMRTTLVVLVASETEARWAHVGDSRLYAFREGFVDARTTDHSVPQALVEAGEITPAEVRGHPDRNRLLRALGSSDPPRSSVSEAREVRPGDAFLLCSDGLWELVTEEEMQQTLTEADTPDAWLRAMEAILASRASGHHDNYTAIATWATP